MSGTWRWRTMIRLTASPTSVDGEGHIRAFEFRVEPDGGEASIVSTDATAVAQHLAAAGVEHVERLLEHVCSWSAVELWQSGTEAP